MKYFVKLDDLKEKGIELQEYSKNKIERPINEMIKCADKLQWESASGYAYYSKYKENIKRLYDLSTSVDKLGSFLQFCSENYDNANQEMIAEWSNMYDEIHAKNNQYK